MFPLPLDYLMKSQSLASLDLVLDRVIPGLVDLRLEVKVNQLTRDVIVRVLISQTLYWTRYKLTSPLSGVHWPSVSR